MTWQEKVLNLMKEKNMTQKELSKLSGITESSISRHLRSEQCPRLDIVVNIAKALGVDTNYLLEEDEKSDKKETSYAELVSAVARCGSKLTDEEKTKLVLLILGQAN